MRHEVGRGEGGAARNVCRYAGAVPFARLRPALRQTPARWILGAAVLGVLVAVVTVALATRTPWLGLRLQAQTDDAAPPRVVTAHGPAAAIPSGTALLRLTAGERGAELRGSDLAPEPDTRFVRYADFLAFLARQSQLAAVLEAAPLTIEADDGRRWTVAPAARRPLADLGFAFWLQLAVGIAGLLIGTGVWAFRRDDAAAGYVALTGVGLLLSAAPAAVYSTRELALDGTLFRILHALNGGGALLFCAAFAATLWHYPTRLHRFAAGPALLAAYMATFAATAAGLVPDFDLALRLPVLAGFALTAVFAALQWRRTHRQPRERAALQWFLLAWLGGGGTFLLVVFVPVLLGLDTGALQAYAFALFLVIYAGLVLGVLRYRLFSLDRWWLAAWSLLLGGLLFLALDLALVHLLNWSDGNALVAALLAVSWLYLPLRHWLWQRWIAPRGAALESLLGSVVAADALPPAVLWRESMQRLFAPLQMQPLRPAPDMATIVADGSALLVPAVDGGDGLRLEHAQQGRRLFGPADIGTVQTMRAVVERLVAYRRAVELGVQRERERVTRELHDDVGSRLLELLHRADGPLRTQLRETLDELRLVLHSLAAHDQCLDDVLGWCRGDLIERVEGSDVQLDWQAPARVPAASLDPHLSLLLVRLMRTLAARARDAGGAPRITVWVGFADAGMCVDAALAPCPGPDDAAALATLGQRAELLGARMQVSASGGRLCAALHLPLTAAA